MIPVFTGKINLISSSQFDTDLFDVEMSFIDMEGVFSGTDALVNDYVHLDTSNYILGTVSKYKIVSIASQAFDNIQCRVQFVDEGPIIDPAYCIGIDGFINRPSTKLKLTMPAVPGVQGLSDKFEVQPENSDTKLIIDNLEGIPGPQGPQGDPGPEGPQGEQGEPGTVGALVEIDLKDQDASIVETPMFIPSEDGVFLINVYCSCTKIGTAGTVKPSISWEDDSTLQTIEMPEIDLSTLGLFAQQSFFVKCKAGEAVSYSALLADEAGAPEYSLYISAMLAGTSAPTIVGPQGEKGDKGDPGDAGIIILKDIVDTVYELILSDVGKTITLTNASPVAVTIPTESVVPFVNGTRIDLIQNGAGKVTIGGAGITIKSKSSNKSIAAQNVAVSLIKETTDVWYLIGDIVA